MSLSIIIFKNDIIFSGLQAYEEISLLYPQTKFNLVLVNVTKTELQEMRQSRIRDLIFPLESVLDDSIACAIWFASRGQGLIQEQTQYGATILKWPQHYKYELKMPPSI